MAESTVAHPLTQLQVCQQIAKLVRAKLPVAGKLSKLIAQKNTSVGKLAESVDEGLLSGQSLANALAGDDSYHSRILAACINAGEQSQRLDETLDNWSRMHLSNQHNRKTLLANLLYPTLLISVAFVSLFLLIKNIVPSYIEAYDQLEAKIPGWLEPSFGVTINCGL